MSTLNPFNPCDSGSLKDLNVVVDSPPTRVTDSDKGGVQRILRYRLFIPTIADQVLERPVPLYKLVFRSQRSPLHSPGDLHVLLGPYHDSQT